MHANISNIMYLLVIVKWEKWDFVSWSMLPEVNNAESHVLFGEI